MFSENPAKLSWQIKQHLNKARDTMSKSNAEHTPTPWNCSSHCQVSRSDGDVIADMTGREGEISFDEMDANAEHIVLCVNSHDALVEVLEKTISGLTMYIELMGDNSEALKTILKMAQQALKDEEE